MIKLIAIEPRQGHEILLRFSDGAFGTFDFTPFVGAGTEMTEPLRDPAFFKRCFIEAGALDWPNGFDMSAGSLHQRLRDEGKLHRDPKAAQVKQGAGSTCQVIEQGSGPTFRQAVEFEGSLFRPTDLLWPEPRPRCRSIIRRKQSGPRPGKQEGGVNALRRDPRYVLAQCPVRHFKVVVGLQAKPEAFAGAERGGNAHGGVGADAALAQHAR